MNIRTVLDLFDNQVSSAPDGIALVSGQAPLTYGELAARSDAVARFLLENGVKGGALVPIEATRSIDYIVAIIGVLKANAVYAPIDHKHPIERKKLILEQIGSPILLSTAGERDGYESEPLDRWTRVSVASLSAKAAANRISLSARPSPADPIYVIFTSGTTGVPKGVVVEHQAVTSLIQWHNDKFEVTSASRHTLMAGLGFDVCQWEIWSPLCAGATLHILDDEKRLDVDLLTDFYRRNDITHAFVPTVMVPNVVNATRNRDSSLTYLFTAGEKLKPVDTEGVSYSLIDYYGPTEATIFATVHYVPGSASGKPESIGRPVTDTEILILDEEFKERPRGEVGELFIAGSCLARGYLNNEGLTRDRFVPHPTRSGARMYRTGDLARWLPDGTVQYLGRGDEQVKIRGNRVELGEIESFLATQQGIKKVAVIVTGGDADLAREVVAFLVTNGATAPFAQIVESIRENVRTHLPDYMRPGRYIELRDMPLTVNGKTDKAALRAQFAAGSPASVDSRADPNSMERLVFDVFRTVLKHSDFGRRDSFFDVGGHSLLVAEVVLTLEERLNSKAYMRDVYQYQTVTALAAHIRSRMQSERLPEIDAEPIHELRNDIELPAGIVLNSPFDIDALKRPRHILLTGTTGFVGAHLLSDLLATTNAVIHCPVRAPNDAEARSRIDDKLATYRIGIEDRSRVIAYAADLSLAEFGMAHGNYMKLSSDVDVIYHSASAVNFIQPYSYMKKDNVDGLKQIISFAASDKLKALILLSTISVYSWGHLHTGKTVMTEEDDIDQNLPAVLTDIGYVRSKWVMEKIADLAAAHGLPLMTFRLGYATFNSRTGLSASYQWWGRLVETCIKFGAIPDLRDLREGLTTIDYMTRAIVHISRNPAALTKKFNLIHSDENNLTLKQFFSLLEPHVGVKFDVIPFAEWLGKWKDNREAPLYPLLSLFRDNMYDGRSTVELYQDTYRWGCKNVTSFLKGSGIEEPRFNDKELTRYLENSIGFVATAS
ncbi:amino acid adenylation domain-containing protein [Bradyrhizobium lablabi]|uniref:amino acid adenylation domain-containing protein n=1 Tax=Bradyrhizobium lablabi TaxID=722472 RepID=UPI001BAD63F0|nr:amino acid adenylation domain-containing protein [Bradyrhizobium lablabi]MBR0696474.1 non-ribosomal peptide synthetase [Bradyrhizobium lablabi]